MAQHHLNTATAVTSTLINKRAQENHLGLRPTAMKHSAPVPLKPLAFQNRLASGLPGTVPGTWECDKTSPWPTVKHTQKSHGGGLDGPIQTEAINHFKYSTIWTTLSSAQGHPHMLFNALAWL